MPRSQQAPKGTGKALVELALTYNGKACLIWPLGKVASGRAAMLWEGKTQYVSRIVCEARHGPPPFPKVEAAHRCGRGDEGCYSPGCVYWATSSQNKADQLIHGTDKRGEKSPRAILTNQQAIEIYHSGLPRKQLAEDFDIDERLVGRIKRGERYAHATGAAS